MFPLRSFLLQLESDGIRLTTRDYHRITCVLSADGQWSIERLRDVLISLLAKDIQQREILQKRFDAYFDENVKRINHKEKIEIDLLLAELQRVKPKPEQTSVFRTIRSKSSTRPTKNTSSNYRWAWLLLPIVIILALYIQWINKSPSSPPALTELIFEINPTDERLFAKVGEEDTELFNLSNPSLDKIKIKKLSLSGKDKEEFTIEPHECTRTEISREQDCQIQISFLPQVKGNKTVNLEVESSIGSYSFKLDAQTRSIEKTILEPKPELENKKEKKLDDLPIQVVVPQWPSIKKIIHKTRPEQDAWHQSASIAALSLLLTVIFTLYLRKYRQTPKDSKPYWNSDLPRHFPLEKLGGKVAPRLDDETLSYLADCMGYFRSELSGHHPDINASVQATVDQGGIPSLVFQSRKQLRHLIILVDDKVSKQGLLNPVAEELRVGLQELGVTLLFGRFSADPAMFYLEDGQTCYLDDFEAERKAYLLLIFSEGLGLRGSQTRYTLEVLSRWPQVAWIIPCLERYRSPLSKLPALVGIPQYTSNALGLMQAFSRFLTECAPQYDADTKTKSLSGLPIQGDVPLAIYLETLLGKALPWAQACSMMQPITLGLADLLRRKYYSHLTAENIEHLVSLPGTTLSVTGLHFSNAVLVELRKGFILRLDGHLQEKILNTILIELERSWENEQENYQLENDSELKDSPAYLAWQLQKAMIRMQLEPDKALITLSQLALSPLGNAVKADLEAIKPGGVPLRKDPETQNGRQRLGALAINSGISVLEHYPIKRWQKVLQSLFVILTLVFTYISVEQYIESGLLKMVVSVNSEQQSRAGAALQMQTAEGWETIDKKMALPLQVDLDPKDIKKGSQYRLAYFYSDSSSPVHTVDIGEVTDDVEIQLSVKPDQKTASSTDVGSVVVTNKLKQVLNNATITLRNGLFTQSISATKTLSLPLGKWEIKVETAKGIGSDWQSVDIKKDEKLTLEFDARYFRDGLKIGGFGPIMILIPAGKFNMGDSEHQPVHEVKLNAFAIGQYEITFAEYDAFCDATGRDKPEDEGWGRGSGSQPVINVSWDDAKAYADWLTKETGVEYRLPTEAEWEYVARAGTETTYWWGNEASHDHTNYGNDECCGGWVEGKDMWFYTAPVGSFSANPFGIYDIAGNVWEWTNDWYDGNYYTNSPTENPGGPDNGSIRVFRSGNWGSSARSSRSAIRGRNNPGRRRMGLGFRLARTNPLPSNPFTLGLPKKLEKPKPKKILKHKELKTPVKKQENPDIEPKTPLVEQQKLLGSAAYTFFTEPLKQGGNTPKMIFIPGGDFKMGDIQGGGDSNERPEHKVTLNAFAIGKYEITNEEYVKFLNAVKQRGSSAKPWFETQKQDARIKITGQVGNFQVESGFEKHPVINVSWYGANAYADWLSKQVGAEYRLPTEAEWEYSARAGSKTAFHFGNEEDQLAEYDWYNVNSGNKPHKVGQKKANLWGLYDIHGNVWEWVQDWFGKYSSDPQENPGGPKSGSYRVYRGGSWLNSAGGSRSALRGRIIPDYRNYYLGFRLARTISLPYYPITLAQQVPDLLPEAEEPKQKPYQVFNDTFKNGSPAPEIVFIPGGSFTMGDIQGEGDPAEKPTHEVTVSDFVIGKNEVTVGAFRQFVEDTGYKTDAEKEGSCLVWKNDWTNKKGVSWKKPGFEQSDRHPVVCISWQDALAYIKWLSTQTGKEYRLLIEAEWEYTARAGSETTYHFGNDEKQLTEYAWYADNSDKQSHQVGKKKPNQWGLNDMHGNVWEWVQDRYGDYSSNSQKNPGGAKSGSDRVLRGGSWFSSARFSRSAYRGRLTPDYRDDDLGFRLARKP